MQQVALHHLVYNCASRAEYTAPIRSVYGVIYKVLEGRLDRLVSSRIFWKDSRRLLKVFSNRVETAVPRPPLSLFLIGFSIPWASGTVDCSLLFLVI